MFAVAAISTKEGREVRALDIGGAFLNADIGVTGIPVHMRLDKTLTRVLTQLDPTYTKYVRRDGTVVVKLDKALYGCVEAAKLWYEDLRSTLHKAGYAENRYDRCVFNRTNMGVQTTLALHVDDILATSTSSSDLDDLVTHLKQSYPAVGVRSGKVISYVGMTFDFGVAGEVSILMENFTSTILSEHPEVKTRITPAAENLFVVREGQRQATDKERDIFRATVAKLLYLAKRIKPECLTAVAFLSTRVLKCDEDDLKKLQRLLGYVNSTVGRGMGLRIGEQ